jgi:hypothetical protein
MSVLLLLILAIGGPAQASTADSKSACEERAQKVMHTLEPDNALRHTLEQGDRGDCVHQPWMDTMRQFGIKQASFLIEYSWKHGAVNFKAKKVSYLPYYYSHYDGAINDQRLREIRRTGLERDLINIVLAHVKNGPFAVHHSDQVAKDVFEDNLLDDDALPALGVIF